MTMASSRDTRTKTADELATPLDLLLTSATRPFVRRMMPDAAWARLGANLAKQPGAVAGRAGTLAKRISDPKGLLLDYLSKRFRERAAALDVRTNTAFAGTYNFNDGADFAALFPRFLDELPDGGLVMCHPGTVDAELRRLDPLTTLREKEYAYFSGEAFPKLLANQGITLA